MKLTNFGWLAAVGALALAACDNGASAVPARDHSTITSTSLETAPVDVKTDTGDAPMPLIDGKPIWSTNQRRTAAENVAYHFDRDGASFGAKTPEEFARKAYAFIDHPPKGAQIITRANGDRLIYDPAANIFAVATKDGQPRTLFKPDDGAAYWKKQQERETEQAKGGGARDNRG